jgi:hypothetical protein
MRALTGASTGRAAAAVDLTLTPCSALNLSSSPSLGEFFLAMGLRVSIVSVHTLHPVIHMNLKQTATHANTP